MAYQQGTTYDNHVYLHVEGVSDTLHSIGKYEFEMQEQISKKVDKYAKLIKKSAKANAPKLTGALQKSITIKKFFNGTAAHIFPSDKKMGGSKQTYRHFQEYGTGDRWTRQPHPIYGTYRGSAPAKHYMRNARTQYESAFEGEMAIIVKKKVVV